jgi:hypothetical protein
MLGCWALAHAKPPIGVKIISKNWRGMHLLSLHLFERRVP